MAQRDGLLHGGAIHTEHCPTPPGHSPLSPSDAHWDTRNRTSRHLPSARMEKTGSSPNTLGC